MEGWMVAACWVLLAFWNARRAAFWKHMHSLSDERYQRSHEHFNELMRRYLRLLKAHDPDMHDDVCRRFAEIEVCYALKRASAEE